MTPEVKKRIEQIRQGIVPEGYVKDKDGIYPRDWASKKIGQWLKLAERSIVLQDEEEYQLVTIRRGFGGVDSRGSFLGKNVLVKNYFIVKTGDFIISKRQIAHGACGIVPPELDGAVVSNEYNVFLPQDGTNIQMFNLMMQLPHYKRLFYLMSDGVHIEKLLFKTQDWMKRTLAMPLLKEQKRIAEILATQDKAIELQARKIEELKRFKKGCLEKMFPRKGQKVPEKRFPGFTDDWEQRKLGDTVQITMGQSPDGSTYSDVPSDYILVQGNADLQNGWVSPRVWTSQMTKKADAGDLIMSVRAPAGAMGKTAYNAVIGRGVAAIKGNEFIYQLLAKMDSDGYWKALSCGSTFESLNSDNIKNADVLIPDVAEQEKIGEYFANLDHLITLHQRKLETLKKLKKAMLQKMFI